MDGCRPRGWRLKKPIIFVDVINGWPLNGKEEKLSLFPFKLDQANQLETEQNIQLTNLIIINFNQTYPCD